ncbi:sensor domain-containing protein [Saccharophagus degradans]|uniref:Diguanylate cyclase/phosphodiesterase with PAS/PAC and GAF sensor(S) n=1 Tax=Saccharophagus degradans (strain 2-40 / ATCC 43961 / DSM 17024) TaxID=203122 RepID=Q21JH1_SACD2|nr:EAL domain-containing protein [Saccharophagus degradans]ABD81158.1 diguanylate cyclase/phosphodiesterase with PAS/PAC and GAF sensor(s) [Saccharophagus degradans 2-40]
MSEYHQLLKRQIGKHLTDTTAQTSGDLEPFFSAVSKAYHEFDEDRNLLERSLEINSAELLEKNTELRAMFAAIPEVLILLDENDKIISFQDNEHQAAHFIFAVEKVGKYLRDVMQSEIYKDLLATVKTSRTKNAKTTFEFSQNTSQNDQRHYESRIIPITQSVTMLLIRDITDRKQKDLDILTSVRRLELQNEVLLELNTRTESHNDLEAFYKTLAASVAKALNVQEVSLWFVDEKEKCFQCALHYNARTKIIKKGSTLELKNIQNYTAALHSGRAMVVENIYDDPRAIEIEKDGTVGAFIHAPIRASSKLLGVLRIEQSEVKRKWRPDEQQFAASAADLTSLVYERWQREATQLALQESEERFKVLAETTEVAIFAMREKFVYANPAMERLIGYTEEELRALSVKILFGEVFASNFPRLSSVKNSAKSKIQKLEVEVATGKGESVWLHTNVAPAMFDGQLTWLASAFDITEQKSTEARLRYQAYHDRLTGLPNRAKLMESISRCLEKASRDKYYRFAICFADIDRFKSINDSLGHLVGDQLLLEVARRLTSNISPLDLVARIGGDEFILLIDNITNEDDIHALVKSLQTAISKPIAISPHELVTSATFGVAIVDHNYEHAESILRDADLAMYQAKTQESSRLCIFDTDMRNLLQQQIETENDLRNAIHNNELRLAYQPIVDFKTGKTVFFEAYVKWRRKKLIAPTVEGFTQRPEDTGALIPAGEWMLRTIVQQLTDWSLMHEPTPISVNLSARQFETASLLERVINILQSSPAAKNKICIEVKESFLDSNTLHASMDRLKSIGCDVLVEGFANGLADCASLNALPIKIIKLHPNITNTIDQGDAYQAFAKASIDLLHSFGFKVVAQGIQTRRQLKTLIALGCDFGQGEYFSEPIGQEVAFTQMAHTWDEVLL